MTHYTVGEIYKWPLPPVPKGTIVKIWTRGGRGTLEGKEVLAESLDWTILKDDSDIAQFSVVSYPNG